MKHKTSELTGALLDAAVAKAEGMDADVITVGTIKPRQVCQALLPKRGGLVDYSPSIQWHEGGPIIERERIELEYFDTGAAAGDAKWRANIDQWVDGWRTEHLQEIAVGYGDTPLIAAMRAFVASKLGQEVEL